MAGGSNGSSGDSPTTSLEKFRRQHRTSSSTAQSAQQPSRSTGPGPFTLITIRQADPRPSTPVQPADRAGHGQPPVQEARTILQPTQTSRNAPPATTSSRSPPRGTETDPPTLTLIRTTVPRVTVKAAAASSGEQAAGPSSAAMPRKRSRDTSSLIRLGIETEFLLAARRPAEQGASDLRQFARKLADNHDRKVRSEYPRMHQSLRLPKDRDDYKKWSMVYENSNATSGEPWGIEMRTPILELKPAWRDNVLATWSYLVQNYVVSSNHECATHIHISLAPQYDLDQVKRIASASLYFETSFEALMPEDRRGNEWAQSNWLESPHLAQKNKSRLQSIEEIERAPDIHAIAVLMQTLNDARYAWNFWPLMTTKQTIEFRKPPASTTADEALTWAELALNFVQASIEYGSLTSLQRFPAHVKGLRLFLAEVNDPEINAPDRLQVLWAGVSPTAAVEPRYAASIMYKTDKEIKVKTSADIKRIRGHAKFWK